MVSVLEIYVCHAPGDLEAANAIAKRLERTAESRVILDGSGPVLETWEGGLSSSAILLLLSPDSVPPRVKREEWAALLDHAGKAREPSLACVLQRQCAYPALLERGAFFRWDNDPLFRIQCWAVGLHPPLPGRGFVPAALPCFNGREAELQRLHELLAIGSGAAAIVGGTGKTALAQEFSRRTRRAFRDVLWVACGGRTLAGIVGDIGTALGITVQGPLKEFWPRVQHVLAEHRLLLVLDDAPQGLPMLADERCAASLLITSASMDVEVNFLNIEPVKCPQHTVPTGEDEISLWRAMRTCRRSMFSLELAASIARMPVGRAHDIANSLTAARLIEPLEQTRLLMRWNSAAIGTGLPRDRHAQAVCDAFAQGSPLCADVCSELPAAQEYAIASDWPLAVKLTKLAFGYLREGRLPEGIELMKVLAQAAGEQDDERVEKWCRWELSWITDSGIALADAPGQQLALQFD